MIRTKNNTTSLLLALIATLGALSVTPSIASAAGCPNEQLRAESRINTVTGEPFDASLAECRAYEMVSPSEKGGTDVSVNQIQEGFPASVDGETAGFMSTAAFGDAENDLSGGIGEPANAYVARRGPAGWTTEYALPPRRVVEHPDSNHGLDGSPDLSTVAQCGLRVVDNETDGTDAVCARDELGMWLATPDYPSSTGGIYAISEDGADIQTVGGSHDLSHVVFQSVGGKEDNAQFLPDDTSTGNGDGLYEVVGLGTQTPILRLVNLDNAGSEIGPDNGTSIGGISSQTGAPTSCGGSTPDGDRYQAISEDGATVYFTACPESSEVNTVYARIDAKETVAVSNPEPAQCTTCEPTPASAAYQGASADGSKVFFTTAQQLTNADTDNTLDLYEYDFDRPQGQNIVQLSAGGLGDATPGAGANVQGVVRTSEDGSHVYFVATGVLTTIPNALGEQAQGGADNLYAVDTATEETKFVADLCSNASESGSVSDTRCPATLNSTLGLSGVNDLALWGGGLEDVHRMAQTTPDGRYLVFTTYARLITSGPEADTSGAQQVYRYDFQTGELLRVSIGEPSFPASQNGNTPGRDAQVDALVAEGEGNTGAAADINDWSRAISDDGETIVFHTAERLQANDVDEGAQPSCSNAVNGTTGCNVYIWHYQKKAASENQGEVHMASPGTDALSNDTDDGQAALSASGRDVFLFTRASLVAQDTDEVIDLYDVRIDGGFPAPPLGASCAGEAWTCQGSGSEPPPVPKPEGSATQQAGGNLTALPFEEVLQTEHKNKSLTCQEKAREIRSAKKRKQALKRCRPQRHQRKARRGNTKKR